MEKKRRSSRPVEPKGWAPYLRKVWGFFLELGDEERSKGINRRNFSFGSGRVPPPLVGKSYVWYKGRHSGIILLPGMIVARKTSQDI